MSNALDEYKTDGSFFPIPVSTSTPSATVSLPTKAIPGSQAPQPFIAVVEQLIPSIVAGTFVGH